MTPHRPMPPELRLRPAGLSLPAKVAQLIFPRVEGSLVPGSPEARALLAAQEEVPYGGYILFGGDRDSVPALITYLQADTAVPLLVACDIEAGVGTQIAGTTSFPCSMALAATRSPEYAYAVGRATALEARSLGISWAFAPVADVNTDPANPIINARSFGDDPRLVGALAVAFVRGCQDHGLLATAKHFPGHGATDRDSHRELPVVWADRRELEAVHLDPFRQCIAADVAAIMTAHVLVPALHAGEATPATLSRPIISEMLRQQMGFRGLVVTDALNMEGVRGEDDGVSALAALQAGCDVLLMPRDPRHIWQYLVQAAQLGLLSEERLDVSVHRVLEAKSRLGWLPESVDGPLTARAARLLPAEPGPVPRPYAEANADLAHDIAEGSLTLIRDRNNWVPLPENVRACAELLVIDDDGREGVTEPWITEGRRRLPHSSLAVVRDLQDLAPLRAHAPRPDSPLICAVYTSVRAWKGRVGLDGQLLGALDFMAQQGWPLVVVIFGSPYDAGWLPAVSTILCAYGSHEEAQRASWRALFAEIDCAGCLPVNLDSTRD